MFSIDASLGAGDPDRDRPNDGHQRPLDHRKSAAGLRSRRSAAAPSRPISRSSTPTTRCTTRRSRPRSIPPITRRPRSRRQARSRFRVRPSRPGHIDHPDGPDDVPRSSRPCTFSGQAVESDTATSASSRSGELRPLGLRLLAKPRPDHPRQHRDHRLHARDGPVGRPMASGSWSGRLRSARRRPGRFGRPGSVPGSSGSRRSPRRPRWPSVPAGWRPDEAAGRFGGLACPAWRRTARWSHRGCTSSASVRRRQTGSGTPADPSPTSSAAATVSPDQLRAPASTPLAVVTGFDNYALSAISTASLGARIRSGKVLVPCGAEGCNR